MTFAPDPIARFLLAVAVIVLLSNLAGALLSRLRQPPIIGEILGGLLLGPSVLGAVWPAGREWILPEQVLATLDLAAQLGLVTFMFLLGCELRLSTVRARQGLIASVVTLGMGLPFVAGTGIALLSGDMMRGPAGDGIAAPLFFGLALSITALPVLARILLDLGMREGVGVLALACAAVGDVVMWGALTVLLAVLAVTGAGHALLTLGLGALLLAVTMLAVRPALAALVRRAGAENRFVLPVLVTGALIFAAASQLVGLHPLIGAFLFGTIVPRESAVVERIGHQLQGFTLMVLLPLFFAGVGLRTSVGLISGSAAHWLLFGAVLAIAVATKVLGGYGGARLGGLPRQDALRLGVLLNCRGVTELVVATIGYQYHLINELGLTVLTLVALITTAATAPVMRLLNTRSMTPTPSLHGRAASAD
ncbi:cation:proton antiporter [Nonomuraea sp. K274]|uniref:Cation:proton antiporter n=1 Tax=Nonomuraea cypriaca TaxID=1187855 RepID=A0A931AE77_9ACTN|nr:cation:proton antiporter [Nonomuraea cypriaca]MBF8188883.1 cation:proton antiporter [Nonomuraea cypriaca]